MRSTIVIPWLLFPSLVLAWAPSFSSSFRNPKISDNNNQNDQVRLIQPPDDWKMVPQDLLQTLGDEDGEDLSSQQLQLQQYQSLLEKYHFPQQAQAQLMDTNGQIQQSNNDSINTPAVQISRTDAGTLELYFPAQGISSKAVVSGAFSVAWFSALIPATTTVAALPFLVPFYLAGGLVAKQAVVDPFTSVRISVGQYAWSVQQTRYGRAAQELASGATADVARAVVVDKSRIDPETRQLESRYELQFLFRNNGHNNKPLTVGRAFSDSAEPMQLANTVNQQLTLFKQSRSKDEEYDDDVPERFIKLLSE